MYGKSVTILNEFGLHARLAADLAERASKYSSDIEIEYKLNNKKADCKSFLMLLSLNLPKGAEIIINAQGEDEKLAVNDLVSLINSKFETK